MIDSPTGQLAPLKLTTYQDVNGEAVSPHILLYTDFGENRIALRIFYRAEKFRIRISFDDFEGFDAIKATLIDKGCFSEINGTLTKSASRAAIEKTIEDLVAVAKKF